jgi:cell division protein FtsB
MKKVKNKKVRVHISFFIMLAFVVYAIITIVRQESFIRQQEIRQQDLIRQKTNVESEIDALDNQLEHVGSNEYVERIARQRLGWVKEDEIKFVEIK